MSAVPMGMLTSSTSIQEVQVRVMSVEFVYACLIMARIKTGETRKTRHVANCEGTYVALHAQRQPKDRYEREMPKMLNMLREMWPDCPTLFCRTRHWAATTAQCGHWLSGWHIYKNMLREDALQSRVPVGPKTRVVSNQEGLVHRW